VLEWARGRYLRGERIDLTELAGALGLGRATLYRWFGSREGLVGAVIADEFETLFARTVVRVSPVGGEGLLEFCDALNRALARSTALRRFVETEREFALLDSLMQLPRPVFSSGELLEAVWCYMSPGDTRTVEVHIA